MEAIHTNSADIHGSDEGLSILSRKVEEQGGEIILLKSALANVLKRLGVLETKAVSTNESQKKSAPTSPTKKALSPSRENISLSRLKLPAIEPPNRLNAKSQEDVQLREKTKPRVSSDIRKRKGKSMMNLSELGKYGTRNGNGEEGKTRLILAKNMPKSRSRGHSESYADETSDSKYDVIKFNIRGHARTFYPPSIYQKNSIDKSAPNKYLRLKWIHGYRGTDCRDNLFLLNTGELVYNMAAVVVLYHPKENTQRHYTNHNEQVKCITLHPNKTIVASGQDGGKGEERKPHVLIWDVNTLETVKAFGHNDFERAVCALEFSTHGNGKYLLAFDEGDSHAMYMYDWEKGVKLTETNVTKTKLLGAHWNPVSDLAFVTHGKSHLMFWNLCIDQHKTYVTRKAAIFGEINQPKTVHSVTFTGNGHLVSGDSNGNILLFKNEQHRNRISEWVECAHKGGVFCLAFVEKDGIIVSCGRNGQISTWTSNLEKMKDFAKIPDYYGFTRSISYNDIDDVFYIGMSKNCLIQYDSDLSVEHELVHAHYEDVWGVAAHPNRPIFASCGNDRMCTLWDGDSRNKLQIISLEEESSSIEFHPHSKSLLVGTKYGKIVFINYDKTEEDEYKVSLVAVSSECIDDMKITRDGKWLAVASGKDIYVYAYPDEPSMIKKPRMFQGHSSKVLHLDWSIDGNHLQSNSSDYELLFWDRRSGSRILNSEALRDVSWDTWTCTIGYPVIGIWPEGADGSDIKSCMRSHNQTLMATGDDFMNVKLFRYPCAKTKAEFVVGHGHSSFVTCVRFLCEDRGLVSVGGRDCSVIQWDICDTPYKVNH